jgi:hypothetical protein
MACLSTVLDAEKLHGAPTPRTTTYDPIKLTLIKFTVQIFELTTRNSNYGLTPDGLTTKS